MFGIRLLIMSPAVIALFPPPLRVFSDYVNVAISYLLLVFALLVWLELVRDTLRLFLQATIFVGLAIGPAGIRWFIVTGSADTFMLYNNLLAACTLLVLITVVMVKKLYDFIQVDRHRTGFLVADVSGHGVPAALIASMIKIAMHSVMASAHDPGEVLRRLRDILANQLREQFVTAAYLYIDSETRQARYSSAGHPPLLYWDSATRHNRTGSVS
ncbi:SpoIIE family protein phosphatase [candidate division KSB1 bacterium]|nr:SpoIIE family protein phosphatase [candidate division KSB1 bacterium]